MHTFTEISEEGEAQCLSLPVVPEEKEDLIHSSSEVEPSSKNKVTLCVELRYKIILFYLINLIL
jgi:hypothetical protein